MVYSHVKGSSVSSSALVFHTDPPCFTRVTDFCSLVIAVVGESAALWIFDELFDILRVISSSRGQMQISLA